MIASYVPIERLQLEPRTYGALVRAGIDSVEALAELTDETVLAIRGIGQRGLDDIHARLERAPISY